MSIDDLLSAEYTRLCEQGMHYLTKPPERLYQWDMDGYMPLSLIATCGHCRSDYTVSELAARVPEADLRSVYEQKVLLLLEKKFK